MAIFASVWVAYLAKSYYDLFHPKERGSERELVKFISKIGSVITGLLLTMIRIGEPFFRYQVKKRFLYFFGIDVEEQLHKKI